MNVVKGLSIFWILYGSAGLLGFQAIPAKFKGHSWTGEYTRRQGITWLMLGIPEFILTLVVTNCFPNLNGHSWIISVAIVVLGVPSFIYSILIDRKYQAMLKKAQDDMSAE